MLEFLDKSIQSYSVGSLVITGIIAAAVSFVSLRQGLRAFWQLRLVIDTPTARIRSAAQGYVELQGRALPRHAPLKARLTQRSCAWYRFKIEKRKSSGKNETWVTIEQGHADRPFLLDDGTGQCLVSPERAHLNCVAKDRWYSDRPAFGAIDRSWFQQLIRDNRAYRMTEERILEGETCYVLGNLETPRRGHRERQQLTRHLLARWKRDPARMRRFDQDGDGEIDLKEWENARETAQALAERAEEKVGAEPPLARIGPTGETRRPFVVSTEDEATLLSRLRWKAFGLTALGSVIGIGLGYSLLVRLLGS